MGVHQDRLAAWNAAQATLDSLRIDQTRRIDVYDAIDHSGLYLTFRPLQGLLGAAIPAGGGVMVTSERQASVQRYTAAHELGHCVMHHGLVLDGEEEIHGHSPFEREMQAQLFAAYFLMPPGLTHLAATRHHITDGTATPAQIYLLSRDLGVSYEAATRQLATIELLDGNLVERLLRARPSAKREAAFGLRPQQQAADVWPIEATDSHAVFDVTLGDEIFVSLPENQATGYRWLTEEENEHRRTRNAPVDAPPPLAPPRRDSAPRPRRRAATPAVAVKEIQNLAASPGSRLGAAHDTHALQLVGDMYRASRPPTSSSRVAERRQLGMSSREGTSSQTVVAVSGTGRRLLDLAATEEGNFERTFVLAPPYDPAAIPAATWTVSATVQPAPARARIVQLLSTNLDSRVDGDPDDDDVFAVEAP